MTGFSGSSMVGRLEGVMTCSPAVAGWLDPRQTAAWRELGYLHPPRGEQAAREHARLVELLEGAGARVHRLATVEATLDAVYPHDPSLATDSGVVLLRPGKAARQAEVDAHESFFRSLGVPILGRLEEPATAEGGDLVWLDDRTLLAGRSYRTNTAGIARLDELLAPSGVEVIEAAVPHGEGPATCLHLMSLLSLLDEQTALVDRPALAVATVELLEERGFRLLDIDPEERITQAANVLALGEGRLIALAENPRTNARLAAAGFEVLTFSGAELCQNGSGGPTCLTRPFGRSTGRRPKETRG